jgi:hypothetical protein
MLRTSKGGERGRCAAHAQPRTAQPTGREPGTAPVVGPAAEGRPRAGPAALSPRDVLRLQRTVGNRAVLRLLGRGARPAAVVQRMTGFEVETQVPVYGAFQTGIDFVPEGRRDKWSDEVGLFLFGGLKYGLEYGYDPEEHFILTADHNELQRPHRKLVRALVLSGLLSPGAAAPGMSNLEYVTPPRDETGPGSAALFDGDVESVHKHLAHTLGAAGGKGAAPVPLTGESMLTGIPTDAILRWVQTNGGDPVLFGDILEEMQRLVTPAVYVQKTTGVLPGDVATLFARQGQAMQGKEGRSARVMSDVLLRSPVLAAETFDARANTLDPMFIEQKAVVTGYLAYLASHLLADALSLTDLVGEQSTGKNLFPYFPKVRLDESFKALPAPLQHADAQAGWLALVDELAVRAVPFGPRYWSETHELRLDSKKVFSSVFKELSLLEEDEPDPRRSARDALATLVGGQPVTIGVEKNLPGLDDPHPSVRQATGQLAIPMEDRYFGAKFKDPLTLLNLGPALRHEYAEASERMMANVPEEQREGVAAEVAAQPDRDAMLKVSVEARSSALLGLHAETQSERERLVLAVAREEELRKGAEEADTHAAKLRQQREGLSKTLAEVERGAEKTRALRLTLKSKVEELAAAKPEGEEARKEHEARMTALRDEHAELGLRLEGLKAQTTGLRKSIRVMEGAAAAAAKIADDARKTAQENRRALEKAQVLEALLDKLVPGVVPEPEYEGAEAGRTLRKDLDARLLQYYGLRNRLEHTPGTVDPAAGFEEARAGLKKEFQIDDLRRVEASIRPDEVQSEETAGEIRILLTRAAGFQPVLAALDQLRPETADPTKGGALLRAYLAGAGKYRDTVMAAFRTYRDAPRKQQDL